jgi:transposase-like protein
MTAHHIVDPYELLTKAIGDASPDLLRTLLESRINMFLSADADAFVGAEYGVRAPDRVSRRNSYRTRPLDTRGEPWKCKSRSFGPALISQNGCWSVGNAPSRR